MNFTTIALFMCLLISLIACNRSESTGENCQTKDDLEMIAQSFDTSRYSDIDFLISFTSNDSCGTYSNSIKIFIEDLEYKVESSFVLRKNRSSERDTIYAVTILPDEKVDSLLNMINQFDCHPYRIGNIVQVDGNYKYLVYKDGSLIIGWKWQDGIVSASPDGSERYIDSMNVKALALEGMLYRISGKGEPIVVYTLDEECENDSIQLNIYPIWGDFITQAVTANHPKYKLKTNMDGYIRCNIHCPDTVSLLKDLEVIVITKESKKMVIEPKRFYQGSLDMQ